MDCVEAEEVDVATLSNQELADVISRTRYQLDYCPPESITYKRLQAHLKRMLDVEYERAQKHLQLLAEFDLVAHLRRQMESSLRTFGPGTRTTGIVAQLREELKDVLTEQKDVEIWARVIVLALDGAWRTGATPEQVARAIETRHLTKGADSKMAVGS